MTTTTNICFADSTIIFAGTTTLILKRKRVSETVVSWATAEFLLDFPPRVEGPPYLINRSSLAILFPMVFSPAPFGVVYSELAPPLTHASAAMTSVRFVLYRAFVVVFFLLISICNPVRFAQLRLGFCRLIPCRPLLLDAVNGILYNFQIRNAQKSEATFR